MFVSSYLYILLSRTRTHVHLHPGILILLCMCPHTYISSCLVHERMHSYSQVYMVLILVYMCHYTHMYVSAYSILIIRVLIPHPDTRIYVSSYSYISTAPEIIFGSSYSLDIYPIYMSSYTSYSYMCVLILLHVCPHTPTCVLILIPLYIYPIYVLIRVHTNSRVSTARQKSFWVSPTTVR